MKTDLAFDLLETFDLEALRQISVEAAACASVLDAAARRKDPELAKKLREDQAKFAALAEALDAFL